MERARTLASAGPSLWPLSGPGPRGNIVYLLGGVSWPARLFEQIKDVGDLACGRCLQRDAAIGELIDNDLLAWAHAQVFQDVLAKGDLPLGCNCQAALNALMAGAHGVLL